MGLFSKKKKVEEKSCCSIKDGSSIVEKTESEGNKPRFIVLGACCEKSHQTFLNTKIAVKELGFVDEVLNIGDNLEIAKYGVMQTPALVIDGRVVAMGKLLKVEDIKTIFTKFDIK